MDRVQMVTWKDEWGVNQFCGFYRIENALALVLKLYEDGCSNIVLVTDHRI